MRIFQRQTGHLTKRLKEAHTHIPLNIAIQEPQAQIEEQTEEQKTQNTGPTTRNTKSIPTPRPQYNVIISPWRNEIIKNIARQQPQWINPPCGNAMIPLPTKTYSSHNWVFIFPPHHLILCLNPERMGGHTARSTTPRSHCLHKPALTDKHQ